MREAFLTGIFPTLKASNESIQDLRENGIDVSDITILMSSPKQSDVEDLPASAQPAHTNFGVTISAVETSQASVIAFRPTVTVPELGITLMGPLGAIVAKTEFPSGRSGLLQFLTGLGIDEEEAEYYRNALQAGEVVMAIPLRATYDPFQIETILEEWSAKEICSC